MKRLFFALFLVPLLGYAQDLQTGVTFSDGDTVNAAALNNSINNATILPTFLSNKGAGSPASTDTFLYYNPGTTSLKQATLATLFNNGLSFGTHSAKTVYAGPTSGAAAAPTFRLLTPPDTTSVTQTIAAGTIDASLSHTFYKVLTANTTFAITNMANGQVITVCLKQAAAGGPYTAAFTGVGWRGGVAPTMTATANKYDLYTFIFIGPVGIFGSASQNY